MCVGAEKTLTSLQSSAGSYDLSLFAYEIITIISLAGSTLTVGITSNNSDPAAEAPILWHRMVCLCPCLGIDEFLSFVFLIPYCI